MERSTPPAGRRVAALGAAACAFAIGAGAFGAHALRDHLEPAALEQWRTAVLYLLIGGLGALIGGVVTLAGVARAQGASVSCLVGGLVFFGAVGGLALGGPRWLGAVAPLGGTGLLVGFALLALGLVRGASSR
ncbi:MAG: DUF423 domain-containing protein [Acidobacteriota bacterium]